MKLSVALLPLGSLELKLTGNFLFSSELVYCCCLVTKSCLTLLRSHGLVARQSPLFMGFPRQEHWSGLPFPSPGDLPDPGIEPVSSALAGGFSTTEPPVRSQVTTFKSVFSLATLS